MNTIELGKKFENEANDFLIKIFDKVEWKSRKSWHTPVDFLVEKEGKKFNIDAKSNISQCKRDGKVDFYVTKIHGVTTLIKPIEIKTKILREKSRILQVNLPDELNKKVKLIKVEKGFKTLPETIIWIVGEYGKRIKITIDGKSYNFNGEKNETTTKSMGN